MKKIRNGCTRSIDYEVTKFFRIMRMFFFFLLISFLSVSAEVRSQNTVNLKLTGVKVEEAINQLEKQLNRSFFFSHEKVDLNRKIDLNLKEAGLDELVKQVFGSNFRYKIEGRVIVISPTTQENDEPKFQTISGVVKSKNGDALPGVTILVKGTDLGTATDIRGHFKMAVPIQQEITLVFSFIGMKTLEVKYGGQQEMNVVLEESTEKIDEVVVTGIFKKSRESYTGSVKVIAEKELRTFGNRNILTTIRNIDPSFNMMQDNNYGSDPNRLPEIQIRGNSGLPDIQDVQTDARANRNTPLFVQDGFEISLQKMMDLNDQDIETITILKDASATALYGSRGANGVVVITTKRPEAGKLKISYRGDFNVEAPDLTDYRLLNARDKLELEREAGLYTNNGEPNQALDELYMQKKAEVERGVNTYWLSKPLRTGYGQKHTLRLEGGDESFRYSASASYNDIAGVMKGSGRKNFMGNITLSYSYGNIIFRNDLNISLNKATNSPYGAFSEYARLNPYYTPYDEEGNLKYYLENNDLWYARYKNVVLNPLYNATLNTFNTSEYTNLNNNFSIEWSISKDLRLKGQFGITKELDNSDIYKPAKHTDFAEYSEEDFLRKGSYQYGSGKSMNYEFNATLEYSKIMAEKHQIFAGVNFSVDQNKDYNYRFLVEGFANENMDFLALAMQYAKDAKPQGGEALVRKIGYTANFNYTYDQRYFIDGSFRLDGSSQFGNDKRFAPFWSVGAGWNVHHEHFFKWDFINQLRLRASYGITGSQNFNAYQAMRTYKYYTDDRYQQWNGAGLIALGNEDLKWQQTKEFNIGADINLWNNRFGIVVDVYRKLTSNLLSQYELPLSNGFSSYIANIGRVANTGFEISANAYLIRNTEKQVIWTLTASIMRNKNKIKKISDALKKANEELEAKDGSNPNYMYREGEATNTIYAVRSLGIDPSNGQEIFLGRDGKKTYVWDAKDKVACGVPEKYRGNISTSFRYKNLSANLVFGYRFGGKLYNSTLIDKVENADVHYNVDKRVYDDRWANAGDIAKFSSIHRNGTTNMTSRFVQKENMLECQNINITYDLTSPWLKKQLRLQLLSIACNMGDLFQISTVKQERGISYPFSRKISLSLSARF